MKKFLPFLSFAIVFTACSNKPATTETKTVQSTTAANAYDTAGLAKFQEWKAQNELTVAADVQSETKETTRVEPVKTVTIVRERVVERQAPVRSQSKTVEQPVTTQPEPNNDNNAGLGENTATGSETTTTAEQPAIIPESTKKGGWSKAAKGAVIGGAGGAVLGAIINKKNPAVGAAIGGVLGGAVGYGIGKNKDKKDIR